MFGAMSDGLDYLLLRQLGQLKTELHDFESQVDRSDAQLASAILGTKRQIYDLNVLLVSLVQTLAASNVLDMEVLEARMDNKMEEDGYSAEHPEPTTADRPYSCTVCYRALAISDGNMTATGMRCKQCARW
jgi:hypothetical protein